MAGVEAAKADGVARVPGSGGGGASSGGVSPGAETLVAYSPAERDMAEAGVLRGGRRWGMTRSADWNALLRLPYQSSVPTTGTHMEVTETRRARVPLDLD